MPEIIKERRGSITIRSPLRAEHSPDKLSGATYLKNMRDFLKGGVGVRHVEELDKKQNLSMVEKQKLRKQQEAQEKAINEYKEFIDKGVTKYV